MPARVSGWWVRSRAGDALAEIGGPRVVNSVVKLIGEEDEDIRRTAIEILNATKLRPDPLGATHHVACHAEGLRTAEGTPGQSGSSPRSIAACAVQRPSPESLTRPS